MLELLWTVPIAALIALAHWKFPRLASSGWSVLIGALIGALYSSTLAFLVGPAISAVAVPFLPLAMTMGVAFSTGLLFKRSKLTARITVSSVVLIVIIWSSFYGARASLARRNAVHLIVIKRTPGPQPLHWAEIETSIPLANEEKQAVEQATASIGPGTLAPILFFGVREDANATVILVMTRDVSDTVRLSRPARGLVTYVQHQDGSWQRHDGESNEGTVLLTPVRNNGWTRIEIESALGTTATEIAVSQK